MNIKEAIHIAASAASGKSTLPILTTIAIKSELGRMEFTASDTQVSIRTTVDYDAPDFSCCIDARRLVSIMGLMDKPTFKISDSNLLIRDGKTRFSVQMVPFENHPGMIPTSDTGSVIPKDAIKIMSGVRYAAGKNSPRHMLNGIFLHAENGTLTAYGSDSIRVAMRSMPFDGTVKIIVPTNAVEQIIKHQPDELIAGRMLLCRKPGFEMVCAAIDGSYPDFKRAIKPSSTIITVKKSDISRSIKAMNIMRIPADMSRMRLDWESGLMKISSTQGGSEVEDEIPVSAPIDSYFSVNIGYFSDFIDSHDSEEIDLVFNGQTTTIYSDRGNAIDLFVPLK